MTLRAPIIVGRHPAIFLDRDGTLVRDFAHAADPAAFELLPGVPEALRALATAGYRLVVISNQSGVARGYYSAAEARATAVRVVALLADRGIRLAGYYFCPHHTRGIVPRFAVPCGCRKPAPGMLARAAADLGLDLGRSWIIGDTLGDLGAGLAAGVRPVLVDIGAITLSADTEPPPVLVDPRTLIARNMAHAAGLILGNPDPLPLPTLIRPAPPPDDRRPGAPHPLPDAAWLARARADAQRLAAHGM